MEVCCTSREEWRKWLEQNHLTSQEVWLAYYKKGSGKPRVAYRDAVEEALCFGWIDGKIKSVNADYYVQRFTPRRQGSRWSEHNMAIAHKLAEQGMMAPSGLSAYNRALENPGIVYDNRAELDPEIPADLMTALEKNKTALFNFMNFTRSAKRTYIYWLNSAKKEETRIRRAGKIVGFAEKNIPPGIT